MRPLKTSVSILGALAILLNASTELLAQAAAPYPNRNIRFILAGAPGSSIDAAARIIAPTMSKILGQPLVVENVDGAGGTLGATRIAQAPKDGYTFGVVSANFAFSPSLYKSLQYDSIKDIAPVTMLTAGVLVLAVNPKKSKATTVMELVQEAKEAKSPLLYGSPGVGSAIHLGFELFQSKSGTKWLHVPYKGNGQYMTDLISGQIVAGFVPASVSAQYFKTGELRPLGVDTKARSKILPDVPPISDVGLPGFEVNSWVGLIAPAGMPADVMAKINDAAVKALADPETKAKLESLGYNLLPMSPEQAANVVKTDIERFASLIKMIGVEPQ